MKTSLIKLAVLTALTSSSLVMAEEAAKEAAKPDWDLTANVGFVTDYYARGISQTWHKPAAQGGFDLTHSSGFYAGVWGSSVSPNTYPSTNTEIDIYAGYNGQIKAVEDLGYTLGLIGYIYPGASWKDYRCYCEPGVSQTPNGGKWNTYEANFGVSYKWLSAKMSYTLSNWYGAEKDTGWDGSTRGTTYVELNAAYPLPYDGWTVIGHVGHLNVAGELNLNADFSPNGGSAPSESGTMETKPDYTDYKVGISKSFSIAKSEGWNAGLYYTGSNNSDYWGKRGYGGASFNGSTESRALNDNRWIFSLSRSF
ncbi:MAG: hypothetical protein EBR31_01800 [Methylophilaceae bacterium]|nr:hypothetical protein [Methylophilaceae bacterium]